MGITRSKNIYFVHASLEEKVEHGFFEPTPFQDFMTNYVGAQTVAYETTINSGKNQLRVYHIDPQGITLLYKKSERGEISVDLFGQRKKTKEVEEKIRKAAKEFEKQKPTVGYF